MPSEIKRQVLLLVGKLKLYSCCVQFSKSHIVPRKQILHICSNISSKESFPARLSNLPMWYGYFVWWTIAEQRSSIAFTYKRANDNWSVGDDMLPYMFVTAPKVAFIIFERLKEFLLVGTTNMYDIKLGMKWCPMLFNSSVFVSFRSFSRVSIASRLASACPKEWHWYATWQVNRYACNWL